MTKPLMLVAAAILMQVSTTTPRQQIPTATLRQAVPITYRAIAIEAAQGYHDGAAILLRVDAIESVSEFSGKTRILTSGGDIWFDRRPLSEFRVSLADMGWGTVAPATPTVTR